MASTSTAIASVSFTTSSLYSPRGRAGVDARSNVAEMRDAVVQIVQTDIERRGSSSKTVTTPITLVVASLNLRLDFLLNFFFLEERKNSQLVSPKITSRAHGTRPACLWSPSTSQNGRRAAVRTMCTTKAKERCCDCLRGGARQHGAPTHAPRLLRTLLQDRCLVPRSGSGQLRHKRPGLSRPTATHFHGEHHQPRDRGPTNSGYVRSFHLLATYNTTPSASAAEPCVTITVEGAHECRVHCQLTSPKQGKAVHHDLQRLSNGLGATRSRSRTNTLVVTRPPASRHMRAAALSKANPLRPRPPTEDAGGGQTNRLDGRDVGRAINELAPGPA